MSKITVSAYAVMKDCGDGSQSFLLAGTKEEALTCLDRTEEEIEHGCFYDDGAFREVSFELEEKDGKYVVTKGFFVDTDC